MPEEKTKALQELLKVLSNSPEIIEKIAVTVKPSKLAQSRPKPEKK